MPGAFLAFLFFSCTCKQARLKKAWRQFLTKRYLFSLYPPGYFRIYRIKSNIAETAVPHTQLVGQLVDTEKQDECKNIVKRSFQKDLAESNNKMIDEKDKAQQR